MSIRKKWLPLFFTFALTAAVTDAAKADQAITSAKFNCGTAASDGDVVAGTYATSINIHNPQLSQGVQFSKTIVQALEEGNNSTAATFQTTDILQPNQAEFVDCPVIYKDLRIAPGTPIEGFVVINILNSSYGNQFVDVVGKYTARSSGGGISIAVVVYSALQIRN